MDNFQTFLNAAPDAMLLVAQDGTITLLNTLAESLFGYPSGALVGRRIEALIPERLREVHVAHRQGFSSAPSVRAMGSGLELQGRRLDGSEFPIEIGLSPIEIAGARSVLAAVRDISERKRNEDQLRRASAAKSEFLSAMSHELRTPLNAILGFASLLARDKKTPLTDRQKEMVEHIVKGGGHLLHLIDEVLDLSRVESGRMTLSPEPIELPRVLAEVAATLQPMAAHAGIELRLAPSPPNLPSAFADRIRAAQILMNFGSNAIKYNRPGGHVSFALSHLDEGFVRVCVRDDGLGVAEDKHDRLFQPFQRAGQESGAIEGTGIGLALSRRLADLMGGRVGFHSVAGSGSEFWVDLRAHKHPSEAPSPARAGEIGVGLTGEGRRFDVVYIEDNPSNVAFLRELLTEFERVELHVAPNAEIGVELVRALLPQVVLMDINLPGMSGIDAMRLLKSWPETQHIPVIALSAAAMKHDLRRAETEGFHRYLTKPVNVPELIEVLETLLTPKALPA